MKNVVVVLVLAVAGYFGYGAYEKYNRRQAEMAESFYKTVLTDYPESKTVPLAKLGLAMCRAARQDDAVAVHGGVEPSCLHAL